MYRCPASSECVPLSGQRPTVWRVNLGETGGRMAGPREAEYRRSWRLWRGRVASKTLGRMPWRGYTGHQGMSYALLIMAFAAVWAVLFAFRKDLRRKMLAVSAVATPLGPISEIWYLRDYWQRDTLTGAHIGIEDALFAFFLGGFTFAVYKALGRVELKERQGSDRDYGYVIFAVATTAVCLVVLTNFFGVNSIFSSSIAFWIIAVAGWYRRPDMLKSSVASGVLILCMFTATYWGIEYLLPGTLSSWCVGCNPSGIRILGINIEEMVWDFSWGLIGGMFYEVVTGKGHHKLENL